MENLAGREGWRDEEKHFALTHNFFFSCEGEGGVTVGGATVAMVE